MGLFWPDASDYAPSMVQRMGRVLHWFFTAMAALSLGIGVFVWLQIHDGGTILAGGIIAMVLLLIGRAVRYILAGE
jgi:hypothetical protein